MDEIQARYGYTDEYVLDELPLERVFLMFDVIKKKRKHMFVERLQTQSFPVFLQHGKKGQKFTEFLEQIGLIHYEMEEVTAEEAIEKASNILRMLGNPDASSAGGERQ